VRRTEAGELEVKFLDGVVISLGDRFYAMGPEGVSPNSSWYEPMLDHLAAKYELEPGFVSEEFTKFCHALSMKHGSLEGFVLDGRLLKYQKEDPYAPMEQWVLETEEIPGGLVYLAGVMLKAAQEIKVDARVAAESTEAENATDRETEEG
jgi:hypothetical protein